MSDSNKAQTQNAPFALAIVKSAALSTPSELAGIDAALKSLFPGPVVILVVEDDEPGIMRRRELLEFAQSAGCSVVFSSRISLN